MNSEASRIIRLGHEIWRLRLASPDECPEPLAHDTQWVHIEGPRGVHDWLLMRSGEFEQATDDRLRSVVASVDATAGAFQRNQEGQ